MEAAKLLGLSEVPALPLSHLTASERRAYVIADNKLALNANWDKEMLAVELQGLIEMDLDVELTGFTIAETDLVLEEVNLRHHFLSQEEYLSHTSPCRIPCRCTMPNRQKALLPSATGEGVFKWSSSTLTHPKNAS